MGSVASIYPWALSVPFGVKDSDVSGAYRTTLTLPYCRRCVDCCRWWMSLCVVVPHLSTAVYIVIVKLLVFLHVMVYIIVGCCLQLDVTLCFAAHGLMSLSDIACVNKSFVWARRQSHFTAPCLSTLSLLLELLFVKLEYFSVPCLSHGEVSYAIHILCTDWFYFLFDCIFFLC